MAQLNQLHQPRRDTGEWDRPIQHGPTSPFQPLIRRLEEPLLHPQPFAGPQHHRRRGHQPGHHHAGDDDRGMMIIEWGQEPVFRSWPGQPRYRVYNLSDVLRTPEALLLPNMHCRVNLDIDISYEEATFIKETFVGTYQLRELTLLPVKNADIGSDIMLGNIKFESIDSIVTSQLTNIASDHYDPNLLLDIYRHL